MSKEISPGELKRRYKMLSDYLVYRRSMMDNLTSQTTDIIYLDLKAILLRGKSKGASRKSVVNQLIPPPVWKPVPSYEEER